ncbi:MAG: alpha/beta hydrolase [Isosphaeraceae bacterium]
MVPHPVFRRARVVIAAGLVGLSAPAIGDTIVLKNGIVYQSQGNPDKDGTLVFLWDGLKKTVIRDSKIERITADNAFRTGEKFTLVQPLVVHAGAMPREVLSVQAGPWNELGRREFRYVGSRSNRPVSMEQAIIEIGPHVTRYRGVDGFWLGQMATDQVPREVVSGLLGKVDQEEPVGAGTRGEVLHERRLVRRGEDGARPHDPRVPRTDLAERAAGAKAFMIQAEATQRRADVEAARKAQQYRRVTSLLKTFNDKEIGTELVIEVRDLIRREDEQHAGDLAIASDLRKLESRLSAAVRGAWRKRVSEAARALEQAPDAVRERLTAWRKARATPGTGEEAQLALAMSGFVAGSESATTDLKQAEMLWQARDLIQQYLVGGGDIGREDILAKLEALEWPADEGGDGYRKLELATRIISLMPPPLHNPADEPEKVIAHKTAEGENEEPTEYAVRLPPEYHPLRSYPAVVALHGGQGPQSVMEAWSAEASRRGYIVIAPEYSVPGQPPDYHYSASEHAAVEIALRDARRRYAIDSDRIFAAGQIAGGNMAWDLALGHPDLFAGAVVISGFPAKYVPKYLSHHERLPLYFVIGDLAPASSEIVFGNYVKPMILKVWDVTYVEYHRRGIEEFPEEIAPAFDWMDHHRRDPVPKTFDVQSARTCDNRFHGVVIREFGPNRTTPPEATEVLGQNLTPATVKLKTSALGNLYNLRTAGIKKLDAWLSPRIVDFKRKLEIRINDKVRFKGPAKLTLDPMLEDLRIRGDRQQVYWMKIIAG